MSTFRFTPEAEADLLAIWQFIADNQNERSADRVIKRILAECRKIARMPAIGHHRLDLLDDRHRFWSVWSYLIVYRWQSRPIDIIAVIHGARDLGAYFASGWQRG